MGHPLPAGSAVKLHNSLKTQVGQVSLNGLPTELQARVGAAIGEFAGLAEAMGCTLADLPEDLAGSIGRVWACSEFSLQQCLRHPEWLLNSAQQERLRERTTLLEYRALAASETDSQTSEQDLAGKLREFRNREMVRLAWRDIAGWASIEETLLETSHLAEAVVDACLARLFSDACAKFGLPRDAAGKTQHLLVLGMGKMGAWELNFSSDIDLIFCYRAEGMLTDRRGTSFNEFYTRLAQKLIQLLDCVTEDGFVFRVDMRLRPFGESGPLVLNFDAMERYYQSQAREWERYAMVKARVIAGDADSAVEMEGLLAPFVYRRYLDYRAFGELRDLKDKITRELIRSDRLDNVKLGPGGIREIEFVAQAFQLIRGGRDPALRDRRLLAVLASLGERGYLPVSVVSRLAEAYRFLRKVENRLQEYGDRQTHDLPDDTDRRAVLAFGMNFPDWHAFKARIDEVRRQVHDVFDQIMASPQTASEEVDFLGGDEGPPIDAIAALGFKEPERIRALLTDFKASNAVRRLSARGNTELRSLLPLLLRAMATIENPEAGLARILELLQAVASRNVYFTLLNENPLALSQLVKLSTASPWIVHHIARFPVLLDELLDPRALYRPLTRIELNAQLSDRIGSVDVSDLEQLMVTLCQFKQAQVLRVAATDIMGITPVMVVSDRLTYIAETVVAATLRESWRLTRLRHGEPAGVPEGETKGFAVVAYGKLGGIELGYASDLDLVFLHEDTAAHAMTDGPSPVGVVEFYGRVAKRMVTLLTTQTHAGTLYEIDLRLRPSGSSGLLVSSLEAYAHYQLAAAWTWEQQALIRARFVAGDPEVGRRFEVIREQALARPREREGLRTDVRDMREKMRSQLVDKDAERFDLKQGPGGIADIEFIVQFLVLAHAMDEPSLTRWTDIVRQLDSLQAFGLLAAEDAETLRAAYCHYRERAHRSALLELPALVEADCVRDARERVAAIWQRIMVEESRPPIHQF